MDAVRKVEPEDTGKLDSMRQERDRFVALAFCAADMLLETDADQTVTFAAGATKALTGRAPDRLVGCSLRDLIAREDRGFVAELMGHMNAGSRLDPVTAHLAGTDGISPPLLLSGYHLPDLPGRYFFALKLGAGGFEPEIARTLSRDGESGLLDRGSFARMAAHHAKATQKKGENLQLSMFHLEHMAELRSRLDHDANRNLAGTIGACLRAISVRGESAGRLDGDSYGIVHEPHLDIEGVKSRIETYAREADPEGIGIKVGLGTVEADVADMSEGDALRALQYAVDQFCADGVEGPKFHRLSEGLSRMVSETSRRMAVLRRIIAEDGFDIAFQPIVELPSRRINHYEALVRFNGVQDRDSPYDMITFAEATGLICDFDLAMCRKVLSWLAVRGAERPIAIAANLSGRSLANVSFVAALHDLLKSYPDVRSRLIFEITESARITDLTLANRFIQGLRQAGHKVCLDDFGAGAAAFQYLRALEVDVVKIDGQYLQSAVDGNKSKAFLKAMAGLCRELGVDTIAEMVEDESYLPLLKECGIRYAQGYLFGRPEADPRVFERPRTRTSLRASS